MNFRRGQVAEFDVRFGRMVVAQAREVSAVGPARALPAMRTYKAMEEAGILRLYFAYDADGRPAGYQVFIVAEHPHYAGTLWATADAVYVMPEHRGVGAFRFMEWADAELAAEGVKAIIRGSSAKLDIGHTVSGLGYRPLETSYIKEF